MTALRVAAVLMVVNAVVLYIGLMRVGVDSTPKRPAWLPPRWFRVLLPLTVGTGLWFGQSWAKGNSILEG
jgi:hypothetical protein